MNRCRVLRNPLPFAIVPRSVRPEGRRPIAFVRDRPAVDAIRWSGASLMLGGILLAVHSFTHPGGETARYTFDPLWVPSHVIGAVAYLLIPLGLIGLCARQSEKMGLLGLLGFVLTFVGGTLSA